MRYVAKREDVRDLILDAVDVLLAKFGYKKMTMDDVARQVGIGKGTIYLHFLSKEELILSHVDRIADRVLARLYEIATAASPHSERIRQMLVARVLIRFDSIAHYSQSLNDLLSSVRQALLARREAHFDAEAETFEKVLRDGAQSGTLDCPGPKEVSRALIQSTNSFLPFNLSARELGSRKALAAEVDGLARLLVKGLTPRDNPRDE